MTQGRAILVSVALPSILIAGALFPLLYGSKRGLQAWSIWSATTLVLCTAIGVILDTRAKRAGARRNAKPDK
jgi:hypothetical protein